MAGLVELLAVAWAALVVMVWAGVVAFGRVGRSAWVARAWLYAPLWAPVALLGAALTPGVGGALLGLPDHCLEHVHHHHLCLIHPPHASGYAVMWLAPLLVALVGLVMGARAWRGLWQRVALTGALVAVGEASALGDDVRVVQSDAPLAWTVGWWRPRIILSEGLLARLSPEALQVVLAHERAHMRRRDPLRGVLDLLAAALLPARVAAPLLASSALARELRCDAAAAREVGDELIVARALVEVARYQLQAPRVGLSITSGDLEARVRALLSPPQTTPRWTRWALVAGGLLLGVGPVHQLLERGLSSLMH